MKSLLYRQKDHKLSNHIFDINQVIMFPYFETLN